MYARLLVTVSLACLTSTAQDARPPEPRYTSDGQLQRPDNYREWVFLTSGLGMTYGTVQNTNASPRFDNVFVTPQSYRAFLETGKWPDKTMFVLEVRSSATKGSINKGGNFQEDIVAVEVEVKDSRFPKQWAFFDFGTSARTAEPLPSTARCYSCHSTNGAVDNTFVQFYPTLMPIAKAKGTFKASTEN